MLEKNIIADLFSEFAQKSKVDLSDSVVGMLRPVKHQMNFKKFETLYLFI